MKRRKKWRRGSLANGSQDKEEGRISKKEMTNVINTMHHIPNATHSGKRVARLFIAQEIGKSWRNTRSWRLFAACFTLIKLRYIRARTETFNCKVVPRVFTFAYVAHSRRSINICNFAIRKRKKKKTFTRNLFTKFIRSLKSNAEAIKYIFFSLKRDVYELIVSITFHKNKELFSKRIKIYGV